MSAEAELSDVLQELAASSRPSRDQMRRYLRLVREVKHRDPESIARYGFPLLQSKSGIPDEEYWTLHEQVAIAALECGAHSKAAGLINSVLKQFPDSMRARRLQGMYFEATGREDKAEDLYRDFLKEQPSCDIMLKRLVAVEKSRGNTAGAIDTLRKYLDTYQNDKEAWEELAELYLEAGLYKQAAFCFEELMLMMPSNANYVLRYASSLYTAGGANSYKVARTYYARAAQLSAGLSVRALYGICACTAQLDKEARGLNQELAPTAAEALLKQYAEQAPDKVPLLKTLLLKQGVL